MTTSPASKTSRKPWPIVAAVVVLALLGWFGYRALSPSGTAPAATFTLLSGEKVSTADLKGASTVCLSIDESSGTTSGVEP